MSVHAIPALVDLEKLHILLVRHLREPREFSSGDGLINRPLSLEFVPDLDATEIANLDRIVTLAGRGELGPTEEQIIRDERARLAAYLANASPTAGETVTALKALIRVVRAIARE